MNNILHFCSNLFITKSSIYILESIITCLIFYGSSHNLALAADYWITDLKIKVDNTKARPDEIINVTVSGRLGSRDVNLQGKAVALIIRLFDNEGNNANIEYVAITAHVGQEFTYPRAFTASDTQDDSDAEHLVDGSDIKATVHIGDFDNPDYQNKTGELEIDVDEDHPEGVQEGEPKEACNHSVPFDNQTFALVEKQETVIVAQEVPNLLTYELINEGADDLFDISTCQTTTDTGEYILSLPFKEIHVAKGARVSLALQVMTKDPIAEARVWVLARSLNTGATDIAPTDLYTGRYPAFRIGMESFEGLAGTEAAGVIYAHNWTTRAETYSFSIKDKLGWTVNPNAFELTLQPGEGLAKDIRIAIPAGALTNNMLSVTALSQRPENQTISSHSLVTVKPVALLSEFSISRIESHVGPPRFAFEVAAILATSNGRPSQVRLTVKDPVGNVAVDSEDINTAITEDGIGENRRFAVWKAQDSAPVTGKYQVQITRNTLIDIFEILVSASDISSASPRLMLPTERAVIGPVPTFSWEAFCSPERRKGETTSYVIDVATENFETAWWREVDGSVTSVMYNFDGQAKYKELPVGKICIFLNANEAREERINGSTVIRKRITTKNINAQVATQPMVRFEVTQCGMTPDGFKIVFSGLPLASYDLEFSTDFKQWEFLSRVTSDSGTFQLIDQRAYPQQRFYRVSAAEKYVAFEYTAIVKGSANVEPEGGKSTITLRGAGEDAEEVEVVADGENRQRTLDLSRTGKIADGTAMIELPPSAVWEHPCAARAPSTGQPNGLYVEGKIHLLGCCEKRSVTMEIVIVGNADLKSQGSLCNGSTGPLFIDGYSVQRDILVSGTQSETFVLQPPLVMSKTFVVNKCNPITTYTAQWNFPAANNNNDTNSSVSVMVTLLGAQKIIKSVCLCGCNLPYP